MESEASLSTSTGTLSNLRPLTIFSSYLLLALFLTSLIISSLLISYRKNASYLMQTAPLFRLRLIIFSVLATASLGMTWYHMFQFFVHSYKQWALIHSTYLPSSFQEGIWSSIGGGEGGLMLGSWLRDTTLFRDAWWEACRTDRRWWWTSQIFGHAFGWSMSVGSEGYRRAIPHLLLYILLGQIVAISFAQNLFALAVLLNPPTSTQANTIAAKKSAQSTSSSHPMILALLAISIGVAWSVFQIPSALYAGPFMLYLLAPHAALFVVPYLTAKLEASHMALAKSFWGGVMQGFVGYNAVKVVKGLGLGKGFGMDVLVAFGEVVLQTLNEHPAVTSVGWDVLFCWVHAALVDGARILEW